MSTRTTEPVTHPEDSEVFKEWGKIVIWAKQPFDNYLWDVLVLRKGGDYVTWVYNGCNGGSLNYGHYDLMTYDEAMEDFKERVMRCMRVGGMC